MTRESEGLVVLLTGPTGVGKSTVGNLIANSESAISLVEFDSVHGMFPRPLLAYWGGVDGARQRTDAEDLTMALVRHFAQDVPVVLTDVVTDEVIARYRAALHPVPIVVVLLLCDQTDAWNRFSGREWLALTPEDWSMVFDQTGDLRSADCVVDTTRMSAQEVADVVLGIVAERLD